jgi:hypothetical protein
MKGFYTIGADAYKRLPYVKPEHTFKCWRCGEEHTLKPMEQNGEKTASLLVYFCLGETYLGAVKGRSLIDYQREKELKKV